MAIASELAIDTTATAQDMAQSMFGAGIQILSASFSGDAVSSGIYSGADTTIPGITPSDTGVILSTGNVGDFTNSSGTTNTNTIASTGTDVAGGINGDADLNAVSGVATFDGAIFEASFIPDGDYITMQFVFSSEEYLEYVNGGVNDAVGVWVNGAFVPLTIATNNTVSIDTINNTVNSNLYVNNPAGTDPYNTEMDGFTVTLSLKAPVISGQTNTIKIGIADGGDGIYDSNLLIMGDSIQTYALAFDDTVSLAANSSRTFDILANDIDKTQTGLTITHINGQAIVAGQTITLGTGEQIRLNADGTITVFSDGDLGANALTYGIVDAAGNTDVGFVTINTVAAVTPDGIVQGTAGNDLIDTSYTGDLDGDLVDANDALLAGQTGNDDIIFAWVGDDTVHAGLGNDRVHGDVGADLLYGDAGNDTLYGDDGNDTLYGGTGDDVLAGGANDDALYGGDGADTLDGGNGNDLLQGEAGDDSLTGGAGADTLDGGDGNDTLIGGVGDDVLNGGIGADLMQGGDDSDSFTAGGGDVVDGGEGGNDFDTLTVNDVLSIALDPLNAENGTITFIDSSVMTFSNIEYLIVNGGPNDVVDGTAGDDLMGVGYVDLQGDQIDGTDGDRDAIYGYGGNDTLIGGADADTLFGGDDRDSFLVGAGDVVDGGEGGDDFDTLDLRPYGKALTNITYDPANSENGTVEFLDGNGAVIGTMNFSNIEQVIPCFTPGCLIETDRGARPVEDLIPGDKVLTRDNGAQTLRWVGKRQLSRADLMAQDRFCPVRFRAGAFGAGMPARDMMVSPQHRVLFTGPRAEMLFGEPEVLVAAAHLLGTRGVHRVFPAPVCYIHLLFDAHEIIRADGIWTESFQPGDLTLNSMQSAQRAELLAIFPALQRADALYPAARRSLRAHEARVLMSA